MATIEELEERVRKIENMLTLISRGVLEQFDTKIKAAENHLMREIVRNMKVVQEDLLRTSKLKSLREEIFELREMVRGLRERLNLDGTWAEIRWVGSRLDTMELRVSYIEKQFKRNK
jgi:polyhydroxyalkanoate synthesis regulator phasin